MGNLCVNKPVDIDVVHYNIEMLRWIGSQIHKENYQVSQAEIGLINDLYETFYYPKHILTVTKEIGNHHPLLHQVLKHHIEKYNTIHSTNIPVDDFVLSAYSDLKHSLQFIGIPYLSTINPNVIRF